MITLSPIPTTRCAPDSLSPERVLDDIACSLRDHGQVHPVRSISDPRLRHPDLLLVGGWERETLPDGFSYHLVVDARPETGERWEQHYAQTVDQVTLVSRAGHKVQTIVASPDGRVRSTVTFEP